METEGLMGGGDGGGGDGGGWLRGRWPLAAAASGARVRTYYGGSQQPAPHRREQQPAHATLTTSTRTQNTQTHKLATQQRPPRTTKQEGQLPAWLPSLQVASKEPFGLTSFALSLLLVFRTNASYERWDGARKIWGLLLNRSRDLVRQVRS